MPEVQVGDATRSTWPLAGLRDGHQGSEADVGRRCRATRTGASDERGKDVRLTPTEWHILEILVRHPGKLVSQRQLLTEVWGPAYTNEFHYLRQYLARLRHKLEPDPARPRYLLTEPGMGYRFEP